jgi:DNA-binding MarR family transcriptional regulator
LRRLYADIFEQHGITFQQYNVVRILRGAGPEGLPTLEIVNRMIDQAPGITRLLDRLESKQLIRRERPANNRRKVICYATEKGLDLLRAMDKPTQERVRAAVRSLSDAEVANLLDYLQRIREARTGPTALK